MAIVIVEPVRVKARRQILRRWKSYLLAVLIVGLAVAYAALPLWLPAGWLARQIERELAAGLGREVRVGELSVGWVRGVQIDDLAIGERPGLPNALLARVGRVSCDFTPVSTLLTGKLRQLELDRPELWLVFDEQGRIINLAKRGQTRGRSRGLPADHYVIRDGVCHVVTPRVTQTFSIAELRTEIDTRTGIVGVFGEGLRPHAVEGSDALALGRLTLDAKLTVPNFARDKTVDLEGQARVEWTHMALSDLPVPLITALPLRQVAGSTTGRLTFTAHPDLGIDHELMIFLDGVKILEAGQEQPADVPDAQLHCRGHWNPNTDTIRMDAFDCETRSVHLRGDTGSASPPILIDPRGGTPLALHLEGRIKEFDALAREWPTVKQQAELNGMRIDGSAAWSVAFSRSPDHDTLALDLDATDLHLELDSEDACYVDARRGVAKHVTLEARSDRTNGALIDPRLSLTIGDATFELSASELPPLSADGEDRLDWLARALAPATLRLVVDTDRLDDMLGLSPALASRVQASRWQGPLSLEMSWAPGQTGNRVMLIARAEPETTLAFEDWFRKPAGRAFDLSAAMTVPADADGELEGLAFDLRHGHARLHLGPEARVTCRFDHWLDPHLPPPVTGEGESFPLAAEIDAELMVKIELVEGLLDLLPRHREQLRDEGVEELAGDCEIRAQLSLSSRPEDRLIACALEAGLEDLSLRWPAMIRKSAGDPLDLAVRYRLHQLGEHREHQGHLDLKQKAADVEASVLFQVPASGAEEESFEHTTLRMDIRDARAIRRLLPVLEKALAQIVLDGALHLDAERLVLGDEQRMTVSGDATRAGIVILGETDLVKPVGTKAKFTLKMDGGPSPEGKDHQIWQLTEVSGQLAGLRLDELTGRVVSRGHGSALISPAQRTRRTSNATALESLSLDVRGSADLDDLPSELIPVLGRAREAFELGGHGRWNLHVGRDGNGLHLQGEIDAQDVAARVATPRLVGWLEAQAETGASADRRASDTLLAVVSAFRKRPDLDAGLSFDLTANRDEAGDTYIDCREIRLTLAGNQVNAQGKATLRTDAKGGPDVTDFDVTVDTRVDDPGALVALTEDAPIRQMEGHLAASFRLGHNERGALALESALVSLTDGHVSFGWSPEHQEGPLPAPIALDGWLRLGPESAEIEQLRWSWGASRGAMSGLIERDTDGGLRESWLGMAIDRLDVEDLEEQLARLPRVEMPVETRPGEEAPSLADRLLARLQRCQLQIDAYVEQLEAVLPPGVAVMVDAVSKQATIQDGVLKIEFTGAFNGGLVEGQITSNLQVEEPPFHLSYTARDVRPGPIVDRYLALTFPGMKATGPMTLIDETYQRLIPEPGDPNVEVGQGELIIHGGTIEGRAAPIWLTRLFPGLNLAKFDFSYMHSWFEKLPSGVTRHQMIYQGSVYNIYAVGSSDRSGRMEYEVGIDLLADFDSRYWAELGQGRIPLFTKSGRIQEDGTLADEVVEYMPRRFVEDLFLKINPVVTAYHAVRKQVLGSE